MESLTLTNKKASSFSHDEAVALLREEMPDAKFAYPLDIVNDHYVARMVTAEFPPPADKEEKSEDAPPSSEGGGDSKPKEEKGGEKADLSALMDLVSQIAQKMGIMPDPMGDPGLGGADMAPQGGPMDLPDVGAPAAGNEPPLPPPAVKHNMPGVPGGASFSSTNPLIAFREDDGVSLEDLKKEAAQNFFGYDLVKADRQYVDVLPSPTLPNGYKGLAIISSFVPKS